MTEYYRPMPSPVAQDNQEIFFGPYNYQQAPYIECAQCATPITVGQSIVLVSKCILGINRWGQLVMPFAQGWEEPVYLHEDCTTEFSHDHITQDECGQDEDNECQYCGRDIPEDFRACASCAEKLNLPGGGIR